jgi:predicted  nucleic acid-binding Zn-ribbon protein
MRAASENHEVNNMTEPILPKDVWRRIEERLQRIEEALQQKPDQDMVEHWVTVLGWDIKEARDALFDVENRLMDVETAVSVLEDQNEDSQDLMKDVQYQIEDLRDSV